MDNPSNHDLHIMLVRIEERQKSVIDGQADIVHKLDKVTIWQDTHEKRDEERFNSLNKYAASVAMIGAAIGAGASYLYKKVMG